MRACSVSIPEYQCFVDTRHMTFATAARFCLGRLHALVMVALPFAAVIRYLVNPAIDVRQLVVDAVASAGDR
jgi:hypothetical protein